MLRNVTHVRNIGTRGMFLMTRAGYLHGWRAQVNTTNTTVKQWYSYFYRYGHVIALKYPDLIFSGGMDRSLGGRTLNAKVAIWLNVETLLLSF